MDIGREKAVLDVLDAVRSAARAYGPNVIQEIQAEIEKVPGAYVSFVSRDPSCLEDFDGAPTGPEAVQQALYDASLKHEEGFSSSDAVTCAIRDTLASGKEAVPE